ncbi:MAG: hypothetical protein AAF533_24000 [Acidobacteriota bacterium]
MSEATTRTVEPRLEQVVDWSAALWAGLVAGTVFLVLNLLVTPKALGGTASVILAYLASPVLGKGVLAPPIEPSGGTIAIGLLTHFVLSILFACLIAFLLHRWGLLIGVLGGAALGVAIYLVNVYTMTLFFPWFFNMKSTVFLLTHVAFGAVAGGVYEALEVEEFVLADDDDDEPAATPEEATP